MIIRHANVGDVKTLQDLNDEVFVDNSKYDSDIKTDWAKSEAGKDYFTNVVNNSNSICLMAEENNKPIGYISASIKEVEYRVSKYIEIENMGILPNHRSKGIGSKLMEACLSSAKERGFQRVYVNVYFKNSKAVEFYETNGFKKIDICLDRDI